MEDGMKNLIKEIVAKRSPGLAERLFGGDAIGADIRPAIKSIDASEQVAQYVVYSPYYTDAHDDYMIPRDIRAAAWEYAKTGMLVKDSHREPISAHVVASWIEPYPTADDEAAAMSGQEHRIYKRAVGGDFVRSGEWLVDIYYPEEGDWQKVAKGEHRGISMGGLAITLEEGEFLPPKVTDEIAIG